MYRFWISGWLSFISKMLFEEMDSEYNDDDYLSREDYEEILSPFRMKWFEREIRTSDSEERLEKGPITLDSDNEMKFPYEKMQQLAMHLLSSGIDPSYLAEWLIQNKSYEDLQSLLSDLIIKKMLLMKRRYENVCRIREERPELDLMKGINMEAISEFDRMCDALERSTREETTRSMVMLAWNYAEVNNYDKQNLVLRIYELTPRDYENFINKISSGQLQ